MKTTKNLILSIILTVCCAKSEAQIIINGDFENNTGMPCDYNLINSDFNLKMPNAFAFGPGNEIDIMSNCAPYCDSAQHGNWYIGVASSGTSPDEVSLTLSAPLIAGNTYSLSYWDHGSAGSGYPPCPLNIGLSLVNNALGTIVYTSPAPTPGVWTNRIFSFVAPNNGQFITVQAATSQWAQFDNFAFLNGISFQNTCFGDSTNFMILNVNGLAGAAWDFNDPLSGINNVSTVFNPYHIFSAPGTYNVNVIEYGFTGSIDTVYATITIGTVPQINLGNDTTLCTGNSITFNAGAGYTSYLWQDASADSTLTANIAGNYFVTVNNNGCIASDSVLLQFTLCSAPLISFTASDTSFCETQCVNFVDLSANNPVSWQWYFPGAQPDTSTLQNPTGICYTGSGNYAVTLIVCNGFGCDSLQFPAYIHSDAIPSVNLGNDTLICIGDYLLLDAGAGFSSYLWSDNSTNQTITISSQGIYTVQITSGECAAADTIVVATQSCATPLISLASSDTSFCEKHCLDFLDLSTNNPTSWQWLFPGSDSLTSALQNPTNICYNSYGSYDVTLIACNTFGCDTLILTNFITEYQSPVDSIYHSNDTLFSLPAYSYQWYEVTNGIIAGATNQYFIPQQPGSYYCIITDSVGCAGSSGSLIITGINQISNFQFPISISPNPFNSTITIAFQKQNISKISFSIKNVLGQNVFTRICTPLGAKGSSVIDLSFLPNGIYLLDAMMDNERCVRKIVKD